MNLRESNIVDRILEIRAKLEAEAQISARVRVPKGNEKAPELLEKQFEELKEGQNNDLGLKDLYLRITLIFKIFETINNLGFPGLFVSIEKSEESGEIYIRARPHTITIRKNTALLALATDLKKCFNDLLTIYSSIDEEYKDKKEKFLETLDLNIEQAKNSNVLDTIHIEISDGRETGWLDPGDYQDFLKAIERKRLQFKIELLESLKSLISRFECSEIQNDDFLRTLTDLKTLFEKEENADDDSLSDLDSKITHIFKILRYSQTIAEGNRFTPEQVQAFTAAKEEYIERKNNHLEKLTRKIQYPYFHTKNELSIMTDEINAAIIMDQERWDEERSSNKKDLIEGRIVEGYQPPEKYTALLDGIEKSRLELTINEVKNTIDDSTQRIDIIIECIKERKQPIQYAKEHLLKRQYKLLLEQYPYQSLGDSAEDADTIWPWIALFESKKALNKKIEFKDRCIMLDKEMPQKLKDWSAFYRDLQKKTKILFRNKEAFKKIIIRLCDEINRSDNLLKLYYELEYEVGENPIQYGESEHHKRLACITDINNAIDTISQLIPPELDKTMSVLNIFDRIQEIQLQLTSSIGFNKTKRPQSLAREFEGLKKLLEENLKVDFCVKDLDLRMSLIFELLNALCKKQLFPGLRVNIFKEGCKNGSLPESIGIIVMPESDENREILELADALNTCLCDLSSIYLNYKNEKQNRLQILDRRIERANNSEDLDLINEDLKKEEMAEKEYHYFLNFIDRKRLQFTEEIIDQFKKEVDQEITTLTKDFQVTENKTRLENLKKLSGFYADQIAKSKNLPINNVRDNTINALCDELDRLSILLEAYNAQDAVDEIKQEEEDFSQNEMTASQQAKFQALSKVLIKSLENEIKKIGPVKIKDKPDIHDSIAEYIADIDVSIHATNQLIDNLEKVETRSEFRNKLIQDLKAKKNNFDENKKQINRISEHDAFHAIQIIDMSKSPGDDTISACCAEIDLIDSLFKTLEELDQSEIASKLGYKLDERYQFLNTLIDLEIQKIDQVKIIDEPDLHKSIETYMDDIDVSISKTNQLIAKLEKVESKSKFRSEVIQELNIQKNNLAINKEQILAITKHDAFGAINIVNLDEQPPGEGDGTLISAICDEMDAIHSLSETLDTFDKNEIFLRLKNKLTERFQFLNTLLDHEIQKIDQVEMKNNLDQLLDHVTELNESSIKITTLKMDLNLKQNQSEFRKNLIQKLDDKDKKLTSRLKRIMHVTNSKSFLEMYKEINALEEHAKILNRSSSCFTTGTTDAQSGSKKLVGELKYQVLHFIKETEMSPDDLAVMSQKIVDETQEAIEQMKHRNIFSKAANFLVGIVYQPNFFHTKRQIIADKILQEARAIRTFDQQDHRGKNNCSSRFYPHKLATLVEDGRVGREDLRITGNKI